MTCIIPKPNFCWSLIQPKLKQNQEYQLTSLIIYIEMISFICSIIFKIYLSFYYRSEMGNTGKVNFDDANLTPQEQAMARQFQENHKIFDKYLVKVELRSSLAYKVSVSSEAYLGEVKDVIIQLLREKVNDFFLLSIATFIGYQFTQIHGDDVLLALRSHKDSFQYVLSNKGDLYKFSWKVSAGILPPRTKEETTVGYSKIFGLYYGLSVIKIDEITTTDCKNILRSLKIIVDSSEPQSKSRQLLESFQLAQVAPFGVFQIISNDSVVDYGIGVLHDTDKLVTFKKHFNEDQRIGRIFFKKESHKEKYPISYDLSEANHADFFIVNPDDLNTIQQGNKFVTINFDKDFENIPKFLSKKSINQIAFGKVGYAIGFDHEGGKITLHKMKFQLDSHIMNLRLKQSTAILFTYKGNQQYCYGFYEDTEDKSWGCDLFLSREFLKEKQQAQNEVHIEGSNVKPVVDAQGMVPFKSIGILKAPDGGRGTAQLLQHPKGCKYLITCAHNFLGDSSDNSGNTIFYDHHKKQESLAGYSFYLPSYNIFKILRYQMKRVNEFKIKHVHIPKQYMDYFSVAEEERSKGKEVIFPEIGDIPQFSYVAGLNTLHDIAIIELKKNLIETHGFKIEEQKQIKGYVQIAGFPEKLSKPTIQESTILMESTQSHPNDPSYFRLSQDSQGDILLRHRLDTEKGNSGCAIYERISEQVCHLVAIHTTGVNVASLGKNYNIGTYIHSKNIKKWLDGVFQQMKQ